MSATDSRSPARRRVAASGRFWTWFFGTVTVIIAASAVLVALSLRHVPSEAQVAAARERALEVVARWNGQTLAQAFPDTEAQIDAAVDRVFQPVYDNIPVFADLHYTVTGEYLELFYAATGRLSAAISERLFGDLDARLAGAQAEVGGAFLREVRQKLQAELLPADAQRLPALEAASELAVEDMLRRFETGDMALRIGAAGAATVAGGVAAKTISLGVAKKLSSATAAKAAGKTAVKVSAAAAGAGTGAAAGSVVPGAGTALGGIIGGILGWLAVDQAVVMVSERIGREQFEAELAGLVDEQKALVKAQFRARVERSVEAMGDATPLDLIRGEPR